MKGLEPSTFSLEGCAPTVLSVETNGLTDDDADACTNACTESSGGDHDATLETLAAALLNLSPDDRVRLAVMLSGQKSSEGQSAR